MNEIENLTKNELKELLNKGWMTHDAMWFASAFQQLGIEKANELNLSAIALASIIEAKRIRNALGMKGQAIDTFDKTLQFFEGAAALVIPKFMKVSFGSPEKNVIWWRWEDGQCFAYKGLCQLGAIERYQCGVIYRIVCWLRTLDIQFDVEPAIDGCLMHQTGKCEGRFRFHFEE
jgi:hypothetical protein